MAMKLGLHQLNVNMTRTILVPFPFNFDGLNINEAAADVRVVLDNYGM